ncbi:autotransporter domain-containing protein [Agrobacterium sp. DE0009]|uniref:autotransporter domain-containing protein n=1 Tax=Agrobacterium sp. DE0009 TaxID=2587505 RepID=UPI001FF0186F|nr:autotransporter domain-containing protein [Agrobacterium sp. DE0009]
MTAGWSEAANAADPEDYPYVRRLSETGSFTVSDISANGSIAVGYSSTSSGPRSFRWDTASGRLFYVNDMTGTSRGRAEKVNADGSVFVGTLSSGQAFRWSASTGAWNLGALGEDRQSIATDVSNDGTVVVGGSGAIETQKAFRWSAATGMTALAMPSDTVSSVAHAVNADGSVIVGEYQTAISTNAFRWTATAGISYDIGTLPGSSDARGVAVSADGSVIAAESRFVVYTPFDELEDRISDGNTSSSFPTFQNDIPFGGDGMIAVDEWRGFRWNATTGVMQPLGAIGGSGSSRPYAMNADGSVIVGAAHSGSRQRGFRWTEATGMVSVEHWLRSNGVTVLTDFTHTATGVSADGNIIVGQTKNNTPYIARIVLADTGTSGPSTTLDDVDAAASGVTGNGGRQPRGIDLTNGSGTSTSTPTSSGSSASSTSSSTSSTSSTSASPSGSSSASTSPATTTSSPAPAADNSHVASTPPPASAAPAAGASPVASALAPSSAAPAAGASHAAFAPPVTSAVTTGQSVLPARSGIIDLHQYASTLTARPNAGVGLAIANTVVDGAHGAPMRSLLEPGRQSFSIVSDIGDNDGRGAAGGFGIADIGYGIGLEGGATARISFGGLYHHRDIDTGGDFTEKGFYIASEISLPVASALHATIGGYYAPGRMSIERGYLNGGAMNYSRGETDLDVWAAKLRFDWLDTFSIGEWNLTPYAGVTYAKAKMGAYSETGGAFPAHFDASGEQSTIIRAGLDGVTDLSDSIRILARAEAVYRLEKKTATTTGVIDGLMGFSFAGQDIDHFWLRGGLGAEFDVAGGTASLNLNVTSEGGDPDLWVRTGWKIAF